MGTRSLTYVMEERETLVCMYRQMDGYPSGHGAELAEFLLPMNVVNGILATEKVEKVANGMGCLAAQLIAHFKTGVGDFYMMPTERGQNCGQEYEYHVYEDRVEVLEPDTYTEATTLFSGTWAEFAQFCKAKA